MQLIDDQGNLFGLVNVIDALSVLIIISILIAGVALVLQPEPEPPAPPETTTVRTVLDLGTQPEYVAEHITPGDTTSPGSTGNLEITDVYIAPANGGISTFVNVDLTGIAGGSTFTYNGQPVRLGRELGIVTDTYQVSGSVRSVGAAFNASNTAVLLVTTVDSETASRIGPSDTYTLAGRDIATVESVRAFATQNPEQRRVFVGLSLRTVDLGDGPQFAGAPIRPGNNVPIRTDEFAFSGEVSRVGATDLRGTPATRTVTLQLSNVDPQTANSLQAGMAETAGDTTVARLTDVEVEPSTIVLTSQDGNIYLREHPVQKDVMLTAELQIRETTTGPTFKGRSLQQGGTVVLDLGTVTIEAEVVSL